MKKPVTVAILGLGNRGFDIYAGYQSRVPGEMKVVAIAELDPAKRRKAQRQFQIPEENCFETAEELLQRPRLAQALVVATQDRDHVPQALQALRQGYHVLCEKPISPLLDECLELQKQAHLSGKIVSIAHVLRYTPFYSWVKEIIQSGTLGEIYAIQALEPVTYWHQAHSFVRGNWRDSRETSPMILAKTCHDLDLFPWLLEDDCCRVSSFGDLSYFRAENAPPGHGMRCVECQAREDCPYDAEKIYIENPQIGIRALLQAGKSGDEAWPCVVLSPTELTEEAIQRAIETGPYGRCVFECDNNVVDHQVVNLQFRRGATVNFLMTAFTAHGGREIHVCGTKGDLFGKISDHQLTLRPYGKPDVTLSTREGDLSGHAGGDDRLIHDFLVAVDSGAGQESLRTSLDVSIQSHLIALLAEKSRIEGGKPYEIGDFRVMQ